MKNAEYDVKQLDVQNLKLTGRADAMEWSKANEITNFVSPWDLRPIKPIIFRALYNSDDFYFSFVVSDNSVFSELKDNSNESIAQSDRVELFLRSDARLSPYYCLEIDSQSRIMDFRAMPNREFDLSWNWPKDQIEVKSVNLDDKFSVEGKISLKSLKDLNLLKQDTNGNYLEIGLYRAKYTVNENGQNNATWITWIDPKTPTPDFHLPESFGVFRFQP